MTAAVPMLMALPTMPDLELDLTGNVAVTAPGGALTSALRRIAAALSVQSSVVLLDARHHDQDQANPVGGIHESITHLSVADTPLLAAQAWAKRRAEVDTLLRKRAENPDMRMLPCVLVLDDVDAVLQGLAGAVPGVRRELQHMLQHGPQAWTYVIAGYRADPAGQPPPRTIPGRRFRAFATVHDDDVRVWHRDDTSVHAAVLLPDPINLAQIGGLAHVGRAAVVNWRRRHPDFPAPIGGSPDSPLFALTAVRGWLAAHGLPGGTGQDQGGGEAVR